MRIRLQGSGHAALLLTELNRCRLSRLLCDVVLQVGGRSFPAHRVVLACAGSHFHSLFSRNSFSQGGGPTTISLDFISAANFEKVLTFIYTGEILTDLIDVGVMYELAERLGVRELVRACHATFPDMKSSDGDVDPDMAPATTMASASACSSSAASCSSLSSPAAPTPIAPSPLPQSRGSRLNRAHVAPLSFSQSPKPQDGFQLHLGYSQLVDSKHSPLDGHHPQASEILPGLTLPLKTEQQEVEEEKVDEADNSEDQAVVSESRPVLTEACSVPDSSAQAGGETCAPSSSSGDPLENLQLRAVEGGVGLGEVKEAVLFGEEDDAEKQSLQEGSAEDGDQWRALAGDIIELSDDEENYIEEDEEDEELMCIENGGNGTSASLGQLPSLSQPCKACGVLLPADNTALRSHAETHLSETGSCRVCGASFPDRAASVTHALTHVGIMLFSCDICELQFCSKAKLIRHRRQSAARCVPQHQLNQLNSTSQGPGGELQCAVCAKSIPKDFKAVRDHVQNHVCLRTLRCGVCQSLQPSRCTLLWHTLTHLLLIHSCPQCACPFLERPLLDRHLAMHAEEGGPSKEGDGSQEGGTEGRGEFQCFLCPQTFRSDTAFHYHLSMHPSEVHGGQAWPAKRKADHPLEFSSSSSSPLEASGLGKLSSLGFNLNVGVGFPDKVIQAGMPFPAGLLHNGSPAGAGLKQKWYRCRYCGKRFAHSGEFTYHLRIHTGEKPYQCKVCLRFFRGRSTMICHLKTHAGALMYRCTVCGLYFSTLKMVSSHMELHKDHLPPDFNIEETFMYNDHSKEPLPNLDL